MFFRIGGPHVGKATLALQVESDNVILDDIWAWRADHGSGVSWTVNTSETGVHDLLTVQLGAGTLDHVINDTGDPVTSAAVGVPSFVREF